MMKVLVLQTNINSAKAYDEVAPFLNCHPHIFKWSIDIEDCDKVLRIESDLLTELEITEFLGVIGYECRELEPKSTNIDR